ncbi:MAG: FIVAR domain-containing protein [Clostridia bacterium]|nr:FIVAR domain-containing protein [Clostridia bacterium]
MRKNSKANKALSIALSVLMAVGMLPMMAFVSTAATGRVYATGVWNYASSVLNSSRNGFDANGPFFISMAIADTEYVFMQTEDNQEFTYTTNFYVKKNNRANEVFMESVQTNVEFDRTFANMVTSSSWALTGGEVDNPNPDGSPNAWNGNRVGLKAEGFLGGKFTTYSYTVNFVANGSAVYNPTWQIEFTSRGAGIGYTAETHNTAYTVIDGSDEAENLNPVFTIRVIDMRELRTLANMADAAGIDITDITGGRDLSGNTYYSQDVVDEIVAALRERLLCDYTSLDAQLARAAEVEENVDGGLGGKLFDEALYAEFTDAYDAAKAVDRYLTEDDLGENQTAIDNAAAALATALDNLLPTRKALISYYSGNELFAQNTCELGKDYNFHDVTDKYIGEPTMERMVFSAWKDADGNIVDESTLITGDMTVYADFVLRMEGVSPLSSDGKWEHKLSENDTDGRGDNYISMWVKDINFNFVQTQDNETFSFYTDLTAYKNDGGNTVRVNDVYLLPNDTATQEFITALGDHDIDVYCLTQNSDERPNNSGLPGALGSGYSYQSTIYRVVWRYIYTFNANGHVTYNPKWNIEYTSGLWALSAGDHDLPDGGDEYVNFTINVTDVRELINEINKAESIYNNPNSYLQFSQDDLDALRSILDFIEANYTLDGSVYYEQSVIDGLVEQIKQVIPDGTQVYCDYTELDAAIALADEKRAEYNDNADNHYINEVWNNFMDAYNAATTVDRDLYIVESNVNQTMIDKLTKDLRVAIDSLNYQTHVNQPCDYTGADGVLDEANQINNDNGKYDDDTYQAFEDAKQNLEDLLNLYDDEDGNNQQAVDAAVQALQDAIDNLNNAENQNQPCDYTMLDAAIAQASALNNDNSIFTPESYEAMQEALAAAQAVDRDLYDNGVNQLIINKAAMDLYNAVNGLQPDKTALQNAVEQAEALNQDDYTDETAADLADAIANANTVLDNDNATVQDVINALTELQNAVNSLKPDKTELEETINLAEALDTTNMDPDSVQALEDAIADAQAVDNNENATLPEVKSATEALKDAIDQILQNALDEAENVDTTGMTPISTANLEDAIQNAQDVINNPDATTQEKVDAINALTDAVDSLTPDKDELEQTIAAAESIDPSKIPDDLIDTFNEALDKAKEVDADPDATVPEIQAANDALADAIEAALIEALDEAQNTDTTGMDPTTVQELEDAIQNAKDVINDPDSTPQDKVDAINEIKNAVDGLSIDKTELADEIIKGQNAAADPKYLQDDNIEALENAIADAQTVYDNPDATAEEVAQAIQAIEEAIAHLVEIHELIPTTDGGLAVDRDNTECYYLVGLDVNDTSFANVKTKFENDGRQIIAFRGETQLSDTDLIGTGCIIKCVDIDDPTIVYEQAVVILYGDITGAEGGYGDGLVNDTDYAALKGNAFFGADNIAADSVFFYAADLDGDKALDAFDCFYLNGIQTGGRAFDQKVELYK